MKPTLANLKRTAARYSIAVETTGGTHNRAIYLDAPDGFQFEPELHCLVTEHQRQLWAGGEAGRPLAARTVRHF